MMTDDQLKAIEARAEAAFRVVCEVCKSPSRNWRMSIPVNEERDSDRILSRSVNDDIPALVAEVRRLRGQVDALALLVPEVFDEAYWCCEYDSHGCKSTYQNSYWKESKSLKNLTAILTQTNNANGAESEGA